MSPELWLWKHTQHHTKAKFSNVSHNLCYSPGGGLAGTAWTARHRSCREEFRAMTHCDPHCHAANSGSDEGEGETGILQSREQGRRKVRAWSVSDVWGALCHGCFAILSLQPALRGAWAEKFMLIQTALGKQTKPLGLLALYCSHFLIHLLGSSCLLSLSSMNDPCLSSVSPSMSVFFLSLSFHSTGIVDVEHCHIIPSNPCGGNFTEQKRNPVAARKLSWRELW